VPDRPQFKVFGAVVVPNLVDVMDSLIRVEAATELLLHRQDMFEDVPAVDSPWVVWSPDANVSVLELDAPALP
jgi:hypothetical protein